MGTSVDQAKVNQADMKTLVVGLSLMLTVGALPQFTGFTTFQQQQQFIRNIPRTFPQQQQFIRNIPSISVKSPYQGPPALNQGSIIWQSRQLTEYVKLTLRQLQKDPIASPYLRRIIDASECITTIEDAIVAIDASVRLLEDAEPEVLRLVDTVQAMQTYNDTETIVRVSADVIRQLGKVVPKLAPADTKVCGSSPTVSFTVINIVASVLDDISKDGNIRLSQSGRQELQTSATVVRGIVSFIKQLGATFNGFDKEKCVSDKETNVRAISAIGEMLYSLGNMFESFGGVSEAKQVRERAAYVQNIVAAIQKSSLFDVGTLDCSRPGDTSLASQTLDDVADLIADVGLEQLAKQLGVENLVK